MVNQREHIDTVAARTDVPVTEAAKIIRAHLAVLTETVTAGESVTLTGFGTFTRAERPLAGGATVTFKPGAALRKTLDQVDIPSAPTKKTTAKKAATTKRTAKKSTGTKKSSAQPAAKKATKKAGAQPAAKKAPAKKTGRKSTR